jgi:hypothetical protein
MHWIINKLHEGAQACASPERKTKREENWKENKAKYRWVHKLVQYQNRTRESGFRLIKLVKSSSSPIFNSFSAFSVLATVSP